MRRLAIILSIIAAAACAACASTEAAPPAMNEAAAPGSASATEASFTEGDVWAMTLEAERYSYLISLAREGAIEGPPAMTLEDETDLERATEALHYAVIELYMLRDRVCETGLAGSEDCARLAPPAWFGEPVGTVADAAEVRRRIDWLTDVMWPFVEAGCDAGRSRQGPDEPDYCAVE
ncbi:MAG: hypothetical protein PVI23_13635 [Maricaulaceae bacterium]|jgi:hypothetical protein